MFLLQRYVGFCTTTECFTLATRLQNAPRIKDLWQLSFQVHSSGTLNSSNEDYLLVNISLVDYNDELPIFKNSSYAVSVKENIKKGEEIITVKATDRDAEDKVLK